LQWRIILAEIRFPDRARAGLFGMPRWAWV
jgi:hypothetical protein